MVSKLNAVPFQRVNSPLLEAVNKRRPSGVQRTTLTGCLTLLRDWCTQRPGTESAALVVLAAGGSIYKPWSVSDCVMIEGEKGSYINKEAGARPLQVASVAALVLWLTVTHPMGSGRAIVRDRPYHVATGSAKSCRRAFACIRTPSLGLHEAIIASIFSAAAATTSTTSSSSATLVKVPSRDVGHIFCYAERIENECIGKTCVLAVNEMKDLSVLPLKMLWAEYEDLGCLLD